MVEFLSVIWLQDEIHEGYHHACAPCNMRFLTKNQLTNHNNRHHTIKTEQKDGTPKVKKEKGSGVGGGKTNKKYLYDKISQEVRASSYKAHDLKLVGSKFCLRALLVSLLFVIT